MLANTLNYTVAHVLLCLLALGSGLVVLYRLASARFRSTFATAYIVVSLLATLTGFGFPFVHVLPSHIIGILSTMSLIVMAWTAAKALDRNSGRIAYIVSAVVSVYFLVFVTLAQGFTKVPTLTATGGLGGVAFIGAQSLVLTAFIAWTFILLRANRRFRDAKAPTDLIFSGVG